MNRVAGRMSFCTIADTLFLSRALALYGSLLKHSPDFCLFVLCVDDFTERTVAGLRHIEAIPLAALAAADQGFRNVRDSRTPLEYCCTAKPVLLLHLFERFPEIDVLTYIDADMFFFSDPAAILTELGTASILVTGYDAAADPGKLAGRYNAALVVFRQNADSMNCLATWREQCLEWCFKRREERGFLDQKYLNEWPARFGSARVSEHTGINAGRRHIVGRAITAADGAILVDGVRLICFHFHSVLVIRSFLFHSSITQHTPDHPWKIATSVIYFPYLRELRKAILSSNCCAPEAHRSIAWQMEVGGLVIVFGGVCLEIYTPKLIASLRRIKRLVTGRAEPGSPAG